MAALEELNSNAVVSIIVPTYNRAHLVGRAIRSVLAQTFEDFELIVVDDHSLDNTGEVVQSFQDQRIIYLRHHVNRGVSAARNTGISLARGAYIAFLDDDNLWLPDKLQCQVDLFANSPTPVDVVYTRSLTLHEDTPRVQLMHPDPKGQVLDRVLQRSLTCMISSLLIRHECVAAVGGFDERILGMEDRDFLIRLADRFCFDTVPEYLTIVYLNGTNKRFDHVKRAAALELILSKYKVIQQNPKIKSRYMRELAVEYVSLGERKKCTNYAWQSIRSNPWNLQSWKTLLIANFFGLDSYKKLEKLKGRVTNHDR